MSGNAVETNQKDINVTSRCETLTASVKNAPSVNHGEGQLSFVVDLHRASFSD